MVKKLKSIKLEVKCSDLTRIDKYIAESIDELSRSAIEKLIEKGNVLKNGKVVIKSDKVAENDIIEITLPASVDYVATAENIALDEVYVDDDLIIVNKPKRMVVHPAPGNYSGTLVNALLYHYPDSLSTINGLNRPGIVHRIDKDTSGLLIVARNNKSHEFLANQIKLHSFKREYEAVVCGVMKMDSGTIDEPIGRHPIKRKQMAVTIKNSKQAVTHFQVLQRFNKYTHVRLNLETGRTHQIRVHMSFLGFPVAGDPVYAKTKKDGLQGQCLHAKSIGFIHPKGEYMEFTSPLPEYFQSFLERLSKY